MRKKLAIISISFILITLIFQNIAFASSYSGSNDLITTPSENSEYKSYDYVIDAYNVEMNITEDNIFEITEKITAYFNVSKHGIIRKIPLENTVKRADGTTSKNKAKITNVNVDTNYSTSRDGNNYSIKIGSASKTVRGSQTYVIKYTYNIGNDPSKDYDELYYNLIGTEWDAPIGNVSFKITMPKEFDKTKLGFSTGSKGVSGYNTDDLQYNVSGNVITGNYKNILSPYQGINIRLELPEGYFIKQVHKMTFVDYLLFGVPVIFVIIAFILWNKFGRDDLVVETVEFYPPEGLNSLDVGRIYKGRAEQNHIISLLVYLANKGYIKITETEEKGLFSKKGGFKLTKIKDYDGDNAEEALFMSGLFESKNEVTKSDLYDKFYKTINKISKSANSKENREKIFKKSASSKIIYVVLMIIVDILLLLLGLVFEGNLSGMAKLLTVAGPLLLFYGIPIISVFACSKTKGTRITGSIVSLGIFLFAGFIICNGSSDVTFSMDDPVAIIQLILNILAIAGMSIFAAIMPSRTPYGNEMLGKIKGFKTFLETAEKEKLEAMVNENPTYFYDILPYTYALGVSEKWMNKFESIAVQAPDWYDGYTTFEIMRFNSFMRSTMTTATTAMVSSPSSSGGGSGFSGGGFSGGGSGGGGGSSW